MNPEIKKFKCDLCGRLKKIVTWKAEYSSLGYTCKSCFKRFLKIREEYYPIAKKLKIN